jgi:uroporphyrinogen-III synthase
MRFIQARGALPAHLLLACVGRGSAETLKNLGFMPALVPREHFDSEALLALPPLQNVRDKKIIIFRGETGRELLANTLRTRGAQVEYAACYRRVKPRVDAGPLLQQWMRGEVHIVTLTSVDGLRNLFDLLGAAGQDWLIKTPAVVISKRLAGVCRELGFKTTPLIAEQASDEAIIQCIKAWRKSQISL